MKIGYLKNLGRHELEQAAGKWQTLHKDEKVSLEPASYDEIEDKTRGNGMVPNGKQTTPTTNDSIF